MIRVEIKGRIVGIHKYDEVGKGDNKTRTVYFTVADRRKRLVNGKEVTDFVFCQAFGKNVDIIEKYFDLKKEDGTTRGRAIDIYGRLETFEDSKKETVSLPITSDKLFKAFNIKQPNEISNSKITLKTESSIKYNSFKIVVNEIEFADFVERDGTTSSSSSKGDVEIIIETGKGNTADNSSREIAKNIIDSTETDNKVLSEFSGAEDVWS